MDMGWGIGEKEHGKEERDAQPSRLPRSSGNSMLAQLVTTNPEGATPNTCDG